MERPVFRYSSHVSKVEPQYDDLESLLKRAKEEKNPQNRAVLWGQCICHVLSLEDIQDNLTFDEILAMNDEQARRLADHMQAVFLMEESWKVSPKGERGDLIESVPKKDAEPSSKRRRPPTVSARKEWPDNVVAAILTKCHFRCCVCPEHRRVADIHHLDGNHSNSIELNGVALCKECHADAHTTSTMRRNIRQEHLEKFKLLWEKSCSELASSLKIYGTAFKNVYYMNVHRLDALVRELGEQSVLVNLPHHPPNLQDAYHTLWANRRNPLTYLQLLENRTHYETCLLAALEKLPTVNLNLLEVGALDPNEKLGCVISFACQFVGQDIPDQNELVENLGQNFGPTATMRRVITDVENDHVTESCLVLDPLYMYSDSSFIQFSESGFWNGIARLTQFREHVGSNDGHRTRDQLVLTPICIGTLGNQVYGATVGANSQSPDQQYIRLLTDQQQEP